MTQNPVFIIRWENPQSRWMVHLESCSEALREKPLLQIGADQFAVLETAGKRLLIKPGLSSILRGRMDPRTIIWLVKAGYDPAVFYSSLATKIYFIDTKEHRLNHDVKVAYPEENRTVTLPCTVTVRLGPKQIKGLLDQAFDWSDDETVNRLIRDTVTETVQDVLKQEILNFCQKNPDTTGAELKKTLRSLLNPRMLTDLANKANRQLCWKGIALSRRIEINYGAIVLEEKPRPEAQEETEGKEPESKMEGDFGFFRYRIQATGGAVITGFRENVTEAVIPDRILEEPVIGIGDEAFAHCDRLKGVVFPAGLQSIGIRAFAGCSSLERAAFPDQLSRIGEWAFGQCGALTELRFGRSLAEIGDYAFCKCGSVGKICFREELKVIGSYAFSGCVSLTALEFPRSLERIGAQAFSNCRQLVRIQLPSGISYIGENAFWHCAPQLGAVVDAGTFAENWCKASGVPYATPFRWTVKGETVELVQYAGDETAVTVPAQVQGKPVVSLGGNCFQGNTAVQEVVLPEGLKTIGANAFARCARLASVRLPSTLAKIDYAAFAGCIRLKEITIPGGVHRLMNNILENCRSLQKIVLCSGIQYIGSKSFFGCTSLTEAVLPETLTKIGMMAFGHCEALQEIRLPEGLKELEPSAFADCRSLKHAELPKSLGIIGSEAFGGCGEALVCTVQPGSAAEKWCRTQRIRTGSARLSAAGGKAQQDRFCTRCGMPLSKLTGKCRNCDR